MHVVEKVQPAVCPAATVSGRAPPHWNPVALKSWLKRVKEHRLLVAVSDRGARSPGLGAGMILSYSLRAAFPIREVMAVRNDLDSKGPRIGFIFYRGERRRWCAISLVLAAATLLFVPSAVATSSSAHSGFTTIARWHPAEPCTVAISVGDAKNDTRSWTLPAPPGRPVIPPSADLRRFEVRATSAGVCVRWTTAAPPSAGTDLVFVARGPLVRTPGGGSEAFAYGFDLKLRRSGARATFGLDRLGSTAPRVLRVRVGRTGSVVSAFVRKAELDRAPANMSGRPPFPYRGFAFEARVLSAPDSRGNRRVDFYPQEGAGSAADIKGRLCAVPCQDPRFIS